MTAIDDFRQSMSTVHALIGLEATLEDPPTAEQRPASDGLRGSVVVLTLACLEGFLQSLFEEQLDRVAQSGLPLNTFEDALQVSAVYNSLEFAHRGEPGQHQKRPERIPSVISIARTVGSGGFSPKALASTKSNPNSETVSQMFSAIGRKQSWKEVQEAFEKKWQYDVSQSFCKEKLDELVRSRNQVAHTAVSSHIVRSYLTETADFVEVLGEVIRDILQEHIDKCLSIANARHAAAADGSDDDWSEY